MNTPFITVGIIVIALVIAAFWAFPMYQDVQEVGVELTEKETQLENRENYFASLRSLEADLAFYDTQLGKLEAAIPHRANLPALYGLLQQMSSESGLIMRQITAVEDAGDIAGVEAEVTAISLSLEGSYEGLKVFLARTQTAPRLLDPISVAFTSPSETSTFQFVVQLNAYSY